MGQLRAVESYVLLIFFYIFSDIHIFLLIRNLRQLEAKYCSVSREFKGEALTISPRPQDSAVPSES